MADTKDRKDEVAPSTEEGTDNAFRPGIYKTYNQGLPQPTLSYRGGKNEKEVIGKDRQRLESLSEATEEEKIKRLALGAAWLRVGALSTRHGPINTSEINYLANQIASSLRNERKD